MTKRVVDVGNCGPDHAAIRQLIESRFDARVEAARDGDEALRALRSAPADLVLVNRHLDCDGSAGLDVIRLIKSDAALAATPVMLVTNFAEYQDEAEAHGAVRGFGKRALNRPETLEQLRPWLSG